MHNPFAPSLPPRPGARIIASAVLIGILSIASCVVVKAEEGPPINPDVTQENIATTICVPGFTRTIRPYVSTMQAIKAELLAVAGEPWERRNRYQLDHRVPLCAGGAVVDRRNLALEPIDEAHDKDAVEACVCGMICAGAISLEVAQHLIWIDWRAAARECGSGGAR